MNTGPHERPPEALPPEVHELSKIRQAADSLSKARHTVEHASPDTAQPGPERPRFDQPQPHLEVER